MPPLFEPVHLPAPAYLLVAVRALSFFNTIAALWLGLTVLLNADRRTPGTWVAGAGLLAGALFFVGHSAVAAGDLTNFGVELEVWWHASWLLLLAAPYAWYLVTALYSGAHATNPHKLALPAFGALGLLGAATLLVWSPLPSYDTLVHGAQGLTGATLPAAALAYPAFAALCVALSVDALRRPAPSDRFMGNLAQRRARPWLLAAAVMLLATGFGVGAVAMWFLQAAQTEPNGAFTPETFEGLLRFDFLIALLVGLAIVLMGRAIVSYEVFTGKALPRRGLFRHWWRGLALAGGLGLTVAAGITFGLQPVYQLLAGMVLVAIFYALVSWRSFAERERTMARLRPFVSSQRLWDRAVGGGTPAGGVAAPLAGLCDDVLGASVAYLVPLGSLTSLVPAPLAHPTSVAPTLPALDQTGLQQRDLCRPIDPSVYGGAAWLVPLWGAPGLVGALLLGEKRDGGLYTEEEIEVAQATAERLLDAQASAELNRRLADLQRQRLAESQVLDQRTRRTLHDDVLPRLQTALLTLNTGQPDGRPPADAVALLSDVHRQIAGLLRALPSTIGPELERRGFVGALRYAAAQELVEGRDEVEWGSDGRAHQALESLDAPAAEVLFGAAREAVRNAARHARGDDPNRPLHLTVSISGTDGLQLSITDDGEGAGTGGPVDTAGSGQGLALHTTMLALFGGTLTIDHPAGFGTRVVIRLPGAPSTSPDVQSDPVGQHPAQVPPAPARNPQLVPDPEALP